MGVAWCAYHSVDYVAPSEAATTVQAVLAWSVDGYARLAKVRFYRPPVLSESAVNVVIE